METPENITTITLRAWNKLRKQGGVVQRGCVKGLQIYPGIIKQADEHMRAGITNIKDGKVFIDTWPARICDFAPENV